MSGHETGNNEPTAYLVTFSVPTVRPDLILPDAVPYYRRAYKDSTLTPLYAERHQVWQWHPAAELPALSKHACSETVIATDGKRVAVRYYDFHDNEWRGERGLDGYLWEVTHWAPMPPMPDSQSVANR